MSAIYRVYLKDEILEFGRKDQSGVFLCQNTAFMFFSALIDQFPDMDMQSFARKFQGWLIRTKLVGVCLHQKLFMIV